MRKLLLALSLLGSVPAFFAFSLPAHAQATRTWVSGVGDDVNPCSRTAPCKTFPGAISKTAVNGEINCLDPAGFGQVTITKSITIDCRSTHGGILNSTTGVLIAFDNFTSANETKKTVRIRGLAINGAVNAIHGVRIIGGVAATGTEVFIEDSIIDGHYSSGANGITDERSGGGKLFVTNTRVRNNGSFGIAVSPGAGRIDAVLDNVVSENNGYGVVSTFGARTMVNRSVMSGNTTAGIYVTGEANVNNSVISSNDTGVLQASAGVVRLSNSDIAFNATGITGTTLSYQNNRISGNTSPGTAPGAASPAQQ